MSAYGIMVGGKPRTGCYLKASKLPPTLEELFNETKVSLDVEALSKEEAKEKWEKTGDFALLPKGKRGTIKRS
jgi:hypothetical protein